MDVHIPRAITRSLRGRGLDVLTSQEDDTTLLDDEALLARATELGRILFSQDQDLLRIAAEWQSRGRAFSGIVFSLQQGVSLGALAQDLELLLLCSLPEEIRNSVIYLPLAR
jgi:hypothetical protein